MRAYVKLFAIEQWTVEVNSYNLSLICVLPYGSLLAGSLLEYWAQRAHGEIKKLRAQSETWGGRRLLPYPGLVRFADVFHLAFLFAHSISYYAVC